VRHILNAEDLDNIFLLARIDLDKTNVLANQIGIGLDDRAIRFRRSTSAREVWYMFDLLFLGGTLDIF
jgi:hypothetical protein